MWSRGIETADSMAPATWCMVFVASTSAFAPDCSRPRAARARRSPVAPHAPTCCNAAISAKSTECSRRGAEWSPPSRSATPQLRRR